MIKQNRKWINYRICIRKSYNQNKNKKENRKGATFSRKLRWLNNMLWGGTALLAFEHVWHGEVTPFFPFLTAAGNAQDAVQMLKEMATAGVGMAVVVTAVWVGMVAIASGVEKKAAKEAEVKGLER